MGQLIAAEAKKAGDEDRLCRNIETTPDPVLMSSLTNFAGHDVVIDFSIGEAVNRNIQACLLAGVPIVEGTTGWKTQEEEIKRLVRENAGTLVYGANFSIGVNVFYRIISHASRTLQRSRRLRAVYRRSASLA